MTVEEQTGRRIVLVYIVLVLLIGVGVITLYVAALGPDRLPRQMIRFFATATLCFWLYRGHEAARWVTVAILGSAGLLALFSLGGGDPLAVALYGAMAAVYVSLAVMLVTSRSVAAFLAHQRESRRKGHGSSGSVAHQ